MRQQTWDDKEKLSKQLEMERANNVVRAREVKLGATLN